MPSELGDWATWVTSVIAGAALVYAIIEGRSASRTHDKNERLAAENSRLLREQKNLSERTWTEFHFQAVRVWADKVCSQIAEAAHLLTEEEYISSRKAILSNISVLIDTGRWYFPNRWSDQIGNEKEPAYRGVRQPVLDTVVEAYDCIKADVSTAARTKDLLMIQRRFVSQIQEVLDPVSREREIRKMIEDWRISEKLRGLDPAS
jgi:hypothetical protein